MTIQEKFAGLGIDNAPGQEALQKKEALSMRGEKLLGARVDFSHGDVDAHMPTPGSFDVFKEGFEEGGSQAYTPYRGRKKILDQCGRQSFWLYRGQHRSGGKPDPDAGDPGSPVPGHGGQYHAGRQGGHRGAGLFCQPENGGVFRRADGAGGSWSMRMRADVPGSAWNPWRRRLGTA